MKQRSFQLRQQSLLPKLKDTRFGGELLKRAHARTHRPLSTSKPVHLILKSSQAKGAKSFLNPRWMKRTRVTFFMWAQKCNIRILGFQNTGNHIHCLLKNLLDVMGKKRSPANLKRFFQVAAIPFNSTVMNGERVLSAVVH